MRPPMVCVRAREGKALTSKLRQCVARPTFESRGEIRDSLDRGCRRTSDLSDAICPHKSLAMIGNGLSSSGRLCGRCLDQCIYQRPDEIAPAVSTVHYSRRYADATIVRVASVDASEQT